MCVITNHSKGGDLNWMAARVMVWVSDHIRDRWLFRCYHLGSLSGIINGIHVCKLYVSLSDVVIVRVRHVVAKSKEVPRRAPRH